MKLATNELQMDQSRDHELLNRIRIAKGVLEDNKDAIFRNLPTHFHPGDEDYDNELQKYRAFGCY